MVWVQAAVVIWLAGIHMFIGKILIRQKIPRSLWLSFAGGASIAYAFLHILPEVDKARQTMSERLELPFADQYAYLIAMLGLITFYGLERFVKVAREQEDSAEKDKGPVTGNGIFWLHIASFTVYNALIGYLVVADVGESLSGLLIFALAFGMHFLVNDYGLRAEHKKPYHDTGRWVVAAAIVLGWFAGLAWTLNDVVVGALFAFLAGSILLNILKEELPQSRESRFLPFTLGAISYSLIMLLI